MIRVQRVFTVKEALQLNLEGFLGSRTGKKKKQVDKGMTTRKRIHV